MTRSKLEQGQTAEISVKHSKTGTAPVRVSVVHAEFIR